MCTNCNQTSNTPCGCNNGVYQEVNICNQCPPEVPCTCPIKDLSTDCVLYNQDDIVCGATVVVPKNTILSVALQRIVFWACTKFEELKNFFRIINIGAGAEIYAGDNLLGEKKLRKINSSTPLITVTQNTNDISIGVDVNGLSALQKTYSVANIGTGEDVYKTPDTVVGNNTQFNLKRINSNTLNVTTSLDGNTINIEQVDSGIPMFIVNSDYTGTEELGTQTKPFKNLQNAIDEYIGGVGFTNKSPKNTGVIIRVQKDINIFTGSLAISDLHLELDAGVTLVCDPIYGQYIADIDSNASLPTGYIPFTDTEPVQIRINRKELTSNIVCLKQGFKNRGTMTNLGLSQGKIIQLLGEGVIGIAPDLNTASPSNRCIIEANKENLPGFLNDVNTANFAVSGKIVTNNTRLVICGLNTKVYSDTVSVTYTFNNGAVSTYNTNTKPIEITNGIMIVNNSTFESHNNIGYNLRSFVSISDGFFIGSNLESIGECDSVFENIGTLQPFLKVSRSVLNFAQIKFISSLSVLWTNISLKNNEFTGKLIDTEVKLLPGSINHVDNQLVETLAKYDNRTAAVVAGLFSGCKFINTGGVVSPTTGWFVDIVI